MRSATRSFDPVHRGGDTRRLADLLQHGSPVQFVSSLEDDGAHRRLDRYGIGLKTIL